MKKQIIKIGNSQGFRFTKEEMRLFKLKIGDIIDLDDICLVKSKREKNGRNNTNKS